MRRTLAIAAVTTAAVVAADVRDGYVTIEGARRDYGVLVDPATFDVVGLER